MTLLDYKISSGLTYDEIGEKTNPAVDKSRACNRIRRPETSPVLWIIECAEIVGMPIIEAIEEWKAAREKHGLTATVKKSGKR